LGLLIFTCLFESYVFFTRGLVVDYEATYYTNNCKTLPNYSAIYFESYIRPWYNIIGLNLLPGGTMGILNIFIVIGLWKQSQTRKQLTANQDASGTVSSQVVHTTVTLLAINMMFICLVCPCFVMISLNPYLDFSRLGAEYLITTAISLKYVYHSCNIILYVFTNQQIRNTVKMWFCSCIVKSDQVGK